MGIYSTYLFPRLMNLGMSSQPFTAYRQELLREAQGKVLEIGFGSGLNLPYYPAGVQKLHTIEVNRGMKQLAQKQLVHSTLTVEYHVLDAEKLPFADATFDTVVSTWTLCSISHVKQALAEVYRVLKPTGKFLFVEHGLSPDSNVQKWQHRLTPFQKILADGCHLDRNIEALIAAVGFRFIKLRKEYAPNSPKIAGYFYIGVANKSLTNEA